MRRPQAFGGCVFSVVNFRQFPLPCGTANPPPSAPWRWGVAPGQNFDLLTFEATSFLPKTHRFMIIPVIEQSQRRCKPGASFKPATACLSVPIFLFACISTAPIMWSQMPKGGTGGADGRNGRCSWEEREVLVGGGCWWVVGGDRCSIWQHTCLPRGSCQILLLQHPLSSETQKFGTAIFDTFNNGTHAEAVNRFLASRNSCRTGHATQRMSVVCTVHLFQMELHPTRTECPLAFCSFCSSAVVTLERSSGTSGTRAVFETETRNCRVFSVLLSAAWRDWRGSLFSTSSLGARSMCSSADHLGVPTRHCHKFVLTVQIPFRRTSYKLVDCRGLVHECKQFQTGF